jgi:hypothetical protein
MRLEQTKGRIKLMREYSEPYVRNESDLFLRLRNVLIRLGYDVIKKLMWKDGHLVDEYEHYVRSRHVNRPDAFAIYDSDYVIRSSAQEYNREGEIDLTIVSLIEGMQAPTLQLTYIPRGVKEWRPPR